MKTGRNDPCHCGSGKKYKHCCYEADHAVSEDHLVVPATPKETETSGEHEQESKPKPEFARERNEAGYHRRAASGTKPAPPRITRGAQRGA